MVTATEPRYTRADYLRLPEGYPAQLVDGALVREPSPAPWHQWVTARLYNSLCDRVGRSRVLFSPVDLTIDDRNVYQPDVMVFERPGFKRSNETLFLQMAESGAVDKPALAPIGFGVSTLRKESPNEKPAGS